MKYSCLLVAALASLITTVVAHKPRGFDDPWGWKPTGPRCKYNEKGVYGCFGQKISQEEKYPEDANELNKVPEGGRWPGTPGGHA
ncbi:hypothetical protein GT037_000047 [Alternaria burnsii]|uniref:Uncharacterized protein n=1 Tax=Alternaria burnsii TaxID=1187904 RepID=A0A8H7BDE1_9PLEO|nr:uncharacterized protein GT037_000047 [Alternaria burnsii]KAF7681071.1 hypothetical protein GT037_000047 [Alternaria burnsii]